MDVLVLLPDLVSAQEIQIKMAQVQNQERADICRWKSLSVDRKDPSVHTRCEPDLSAASS